MNLKKNITALIIMLIALLSSFAQHSISGYVVDSKNRETLIGASVFIKNKNKGVVTDNNGFFSFPGFENNDYQLEISYIGYEKREVKVSVQGKSVHLNEIELEPKSLSVDEVSIISLKSDDVGDHETSHHELSAKTIQSIPTARNDVFSAIKYLPGIDRTEPLSPLFTVRGGDPGENAVLMDGVPIYNPYHSATTTGIFNALTIKNVDMLVGGFGAEYGGRNSAVMYITSKDGDFNKLHGEIEPSTLHSKLFLEFPAGKNAAMTVAGRYYYDIPFNFLFNSQAYFYDLNVSYTKRINQRNRISIKLFDSKDKTSANFASFYQYLGNTFNTDVYDDFELTQENKWNNRVATLIHKSVLSPNIFMRNQVYYSYHQSDNYSGTNLQMSGIDDETGEPWELQWKTNSKFGSEIIDLGLKSSLSFRVATFSTINAGLEINKYHFKNNTRINDVDRGTIGLSPSLLSFFIDDELTIGPLLFRPGIRFSNFNNAQWNYEPRINANLSLPWGLKLKAAWGQYYQYIISMNTNEIELLQVVDYYYPLANQNPSKSIHYIVGLEKSLIKNTSINLDVYYKDIQRVYAFDINSKAEDAFLFSDKIEKGKGIAYGAEILLKGQYKNLSGWLAYSLSWATRQYPESSINKGQEYPFDYNRRHTIKTVINYQITKNLSYSTSLVYQSGFYRSIEGMTQSYYNYDPKNNDFSYFPLWVSTGKNNAKMPALINLDLGIKKKIISGFGKQLVDFLHADESYLTVTVENILFFRRNVEMYFPGFGSYSDSYFPLGSNYLPKIGISYTIKF